LDKQEVGLGEAFTMTVKVAGPDAGRYAIPEVLEISPFVELSRRQSTQTVDGTRVSVLSVRLVTYKAIDEAAVPGFSLQVQPADGGAAPALDIPETPIRIRSMLAGVDKPQPRDVAGPVSVQVSDYRLLVLMGLVLFWAGLALLLRFWRVEVKGAKRAEQLPPPRAAHEIALTKLRSVVEDDLLRRGKVHEYFVRVSETVREYVGNRYGFFALDLTSRELLEELRDRPTPGLDLTLLQRMLGEADLVKFARLQPTDEVSSRAIDGAYELVERTKVVEEQATS
jgi:hypothetical protein